MKNAIPIQCDNIKPYKYTIKKRRDVYDNNIYLMF